MSPESFSNLSRQAGIGLPATVFLIVIIALIVLALGELNQKSNLGFGQDLYSIKAFYAAESGAQVALNQVLVGSQACANPTTTINFNNNAGLETCNVEVNCQATLVAAITYYTFSSTASCGSGFEQAQRRIEVRARSE